jgi:hypothetical protein
MDREEKRDEADKREDPRSFEKITREEREEQSPRLAEEGAEEDRRQWQKTRDLRAEAEESPENEREDRDG